MASGRRFSIGRMLPISLPLWTRTGLDYWFVTLLSSLTLFGFHWLVITFLPLYDLKYRLSYIRRMPDIVKAMFGPDLNEIISFTSMGAFAYMHPVSLAILMAMAIMLPSWALVGQIDRGTIELILATPTSRKKMVFTTVFSGILAGAILVGSMLLGTWVGVQRTKLPEPMDFHRILIIAANIYSLYVLSMSVGVFFSSIFSTRSLAVGFTVAFSVGAYMMHFLSEWWTFLQKIAFLGPLHYFRPIKIAAGNYDPSRDMIVLLAASVVLLVISTIWFSRRDIVVV
jgi:ABC-2 type transport system permease protein